MRRGSVFVAWLALGVLAPPTLAAAAEDGSGLVVHWSAPAGCPDEDAVRLRVFSLAGPRMELEASGAVTGRPGRFDVVLRVKSGRSIGERTLHGATCAEVARSAAVLLALSATASAAPLPSIPVPPAFPPPPPRPPLPAPARPAAPPSEPVAPPHPEFSPAPTPAPRARSYVRLEPVVALDVGTLPSATLGGGGFVSVTPTRHLALGVGGLAWPSEEGTLAALPSQGARFQLVSGEGLGCYGFTLGPFDVGPCAVVELAHLTASGTGAPHRSTTTATWLSLGAGVQARLTLGRYLAVVLRLGGLVPLQGQSFEIEGGGTVHRIGAAAFRTYFGPEVRF